MDNIKFSPVSPVSPEGLKNQTAKFSPKVPHSIEWDLGLKARTKERTYDNTLEVKREALLKTFRQKQSFRVSIGKSKWVHYETFNPAYNLREVLDDEVVIEFDTADQQIVVPAISSTGLNLVKAGITFEYWDHGGKSPHLHIHNLPIAHLDKDKRHLFKKIFIRRYVPLEYLPYVDISLTGIHLIALEWANHWKGCYGVKKLIGVYTPEQYKEATQ